MSDDGLAVSGTFKVAEKIDDRTVVSTGGTLDGIETGMIATIYERGRPIRDPDTKEHIGDLELLKAGGTVVQVQQKFCVIRNERPGEPYANVGIKDLVRFKYNDIPF